MTRRERVKMREYAKEKVRKGKKKKALSVNCVM